MSSSDVSGSKRRRECSEIDGCDKKDIQVFGIKLSPVTLNWCEKSNLAFIHTLKHNLEVVSLENNVPTETTPLNFIIEDFTLDTLPKVNEDNYWRLDDNQKRVFQRFNSLEIKNRLSEALNELNSRLRILHQNLKDNAHSEEWILNQVRLCRKSMAFAIFLNRLHDERAQEEALEKSLLKTVQAENGNKNLHITYKFSS